MKIQLFLNGKGLIYGGDNKRIRCSVEGTLNIGGYEVAVTDDPECIMPSLFYEGSGSFEATYTTRKGDVYELEKVAVRNGRILPPPSSAVDIMELHVRADEAEKDRARMQGKIDELEKIFDTNSLNFIIGGNNI